MKRFTSSDIPGRPGRAIRIGQRWLLLFLLVGLTACHRADKAADATLLAWEVSPKAPKIGPVTIKLMPTDSTGRPIRQAYMRLEGDMRHPGMRPVTVEARESQPGTYTGTLDLTMAGEWVVSVDGTLPGGGSIRRTIDLTVAPAR